MPMTDTEIRQARDAGELVIENWDEDCQEPASYDLRIAGPVQKGGEEQQTNLKETGTVTIGAGEFFLFRTHEKFRLSPTICGHLGAKSYFVRRGLILLCGQHIDPGFEGYLLMGAYNASPRSIVVRYLDGICNVEFHRLALAPTKKLREFPELQSGEIPREVRDYFVGIQPVSLSSLDEKLAALAHDVSALAQQVQLQGKITWGFLAILVIAVIIRGLWGS